MNVIKRNPLIRRSGLLAISPLFVFVGVFLFFSILLHDFYKVPILVIFFIASVYALLTTRGIGLIERINLFTKGAGHENILYMVWIFMLAGAFASMAKTMGAIEAAVALTTNLLPYNMIPVGFFLAACAISISVGTSVGTIVALIPMVTGIAEHTGLSIPMLAGAVVGGAFFGDNLSLISDTTIVATRTQECNLNDKFRVNIHIIWPAALACIILYIALGLNGRPYHFNEEINGWKIAPYLLVLFLAVKGVNVLVALFVGICLTGIIGIMVGSFTTMNLLHSAGQGMLGMGELILVSLLAGGLLELIRFNGGITYIITLLTKYVNKKRGAELSIAGLVGLTNLCTANNTIAILSVGKIVRHISIKYQIDSRKAASILDTVSCVTQSLIPYGAQLLMTATLLDCSPFEIMPHLYYPYLMGICVILSIILRFPKKYS